MATLSTYVTLVQNEVDDTSARAQAIIERAIKETYQIIVTDTAEFIVGSSTYTVTATPSTSSYAVSEFIDVDNVLYKGATDTDFTELKEIRKDEYISDYLNADPGTPSCFYKNGSSVCLVPAPVDAGTLNVIYVPEQAELEGSTVSIVPTRYTNVVVMGSVARFKMYEGTPEAVEYQQSFAASLRGMIKDYSTRFSTLKPKLFGNV